MSIGKCTLNKLRVESRNEPRHNHNHDIARLFLNCAKYKSIISVGITKVALIKILMRLQST